MQIHATNLGLSAGRGPVYGPLTFEVDSGLSVLRGDAGTGRTSLLLTLAGRMKHDAGTLTLGGLPLPRNLRPVQKKSAIAGFAGIDDLEASVTVGAALRERRAWLAPWWSMVHKLNDEAVAEVCAPVFGGEPIPRANTLIWDLSDTQQFLLRITLAMMSGPKLLLVDDLEQIRSTESRAVIWDRLAWIASRSTSVVVSASSLDERLWEELDIQPNIIDLAAHTEPAEASGTETGEAETTEAPDTAPQHHLIEETV